MGTQKDFTKSGKNLTPEQGDTAKKIFDWIIDILVIVTGKSKK